MHKSIACLLTLALLCAFALMPPARGERVDAFEGIWVADGVTAEIWREDGETQCRVVFLNEDGGSVIWDYRYCWYDGEENALRLGCVTRTRERLEALWDTLVEDDWSLNDMPFATMEPTEAGIRLRDDDMEANIELVRLDPSDGEPRSAALAFLGRWESEAATLWVEDHGVAYLFTLTVPMDAGRRCKWTYTCRYDAAEGRMASVDVSNRSVITPTAEGGTIIEEEVGRDYSEAVFTLEDGSRLVWTDVTDGDGEDMTFGRAGE